MMRVPLRGRRQGYKLKPAAIQDYRLHMSGVDKSDQLMAYMPMQHKTIKWWKKLFFHFLTLSVVQAYILSEKHHMAAGRRKTSLKTFMVTLAGELSQRFHSMPTDQPPLLPTDVPCDQDAELGPYPVRQDVIGTYISLIMLST